MIDDGPQFKLLIHRVVKRLELDLMAWPRPPDRAGDDWDSYWQCRFEDGLFRVGLGIRKLIESTKLSIEIQSRPIELMSAPLRSGRIPDALNVHRVEEFYDLTATRVTQVPLIRLCHSIVHSYVLIPRFTYSGVAGLRLEDFLLASDRDRRDLVYVVGWRQFVINVVHPAVNDDVCGLVSLRTRQGDEIRIPLSTSELMDADRQRVVAEYASLSTDHAKAVKDFRESFKKIWGYPHPDLS